VFGLTSIRPQSDKCRSPHGVRAKRALLHPFCGEWQEYQISARSKGEKSITSWSVFAINQAVRASTPKQSKQVLVCY
jgi:hypothetical protein